jgi:hypothetical protein
LKAEKNGDGYTPRGKSQDTLKGSTITVVDPLTQRIDLKAPVLDLPANLASSPDVILPSRYLQKVGGPAFSQKPIRSGPYVVRGPSGPSACGAAY